jgi:hypothetical protein
MALDFKICTVAPDKPVTFNTWPYADYVAGEYALVQKIIKCLFTARGTDAFDPGYGTDLQEALAALGPDDQPAAHRAAIDAAARVTAILAPATAALADPSERLTDISPLTTTFNDSTFGWDINLAVTTANGTLEITI